MRPALEALEAVGQTDDVDIDIGGAALQLARLDGSGDDWVAAEMHLSALAREAVELARGIAPADLPARAAALAGLLTGRHGYVGDTQTYEDPANANLIRVIERRRGLPVALGILWLHCARAVGWGAHGIDFPGHFLLALESETQPKTRRSSAAPHLVLDVFDGGLPLEASDLRALLKRVGGPSLELKPGVLQPMSARRVLLRLQENLRVRRLQAQDFAGGLACTEAMLAIAPDEAPLWREAAVMNQRLDRIATAIKCYSRFLDLVPSGVAAIQTRAAMDELRARLN